jgi:hypothetical protein
MEPQAVHHEQAPPLGQAQGDQQHVRVPEVTQEEGKPTTGDPTKNEEKKVEGSGQRENDANARKESETKDTRDERDREKDKSHAASDQLCEYYISPRGCIKGDKCDHLHPRAPNGAISNRVCEFYLRPRGMCACECVYLVYLSSSTRDAVMYVRIVAHLTFFLFLFRLHRLH